MLAIASGGGHWIEMRRIMPAFEGFDVAYATVLETSRADVPGMRFHTFPDFSRFALGSLPLLTLRLLKILWSERPAVVVTTGSAPALLCMALAKLLLRSKTIWIDSIANCDRLSSSGSAARWFADEWLTQWPHLAGPKGPQHWGAVL
ncbi:UDP-N-acetylglucosamine--LPS N-acetylglucosamine transferase [Prosthecomicrobium sp. N25]|uniref:UDP-N-acetylglucosamine--LPS N-acetylglucosamine transferase n=1 Tax=Prosthecomicrobium sp. N25 TaxID=3129254 RepID=UPI003076C4BC